MRARKERESARVQERKRERDGEIECVCVGESERERREGAERETRTDWLSVSRASACVVRTSRTCVPASVTERVHHNLTNCAALSELLFFF